MKEEREIKLLEMLLVACLEWRRIVVIAIIIAFISGGAAATIYSLQISDPETVEKLQTTYDSEVASWNAEGLKIKDSIKKIERNLADQKEYNENSWMMRINPDDRWFGYLDMYIDTDYKIMPGVSIQNENPAPRICYAYADYVGQNAFYDAIITDNNLDFAKITYLKEITDISISSSKYSIEVTVTADTEENCKNLLSLFENAIRDRYDFINTTIGEHKLTTSDISVYSVIDFELERKQADNLENIESLTINAGALQYKLIEWEEKKEEISIPVVTVGGVIRKAIKYFLIGGFAAAFAIGLFYCFKYIMTQRVYGEEFFDETVRSLGEIPEKEAKSSKGIDALIKRGFAVKIKSTEYDQRVKVTAMHAAKLAEEIADVGNGKIALVSDMDISELEELAKDMAVINDRIYAAGNILSDYKAAGESTEASSVIVVVQCRVSRRENIAQMITQLKDRKTNVLGVMFTDVIAQ